MSKLDLINIRVIPTNNSHIYIDCDIVEYNEDICIEGDFYLIAELINEPLYENCHPDIQIIDEIMRYYFKTYIMDKNRNLSEEMNYQVRRFNSLNEFISFMLVIPTRVYPEFYLNDLFE